MATHDVHEFEEIIKGFQTLFQNVREFCFNNEKASNMAEKLGVSIEKIKKLPDQLAVYGGTIPYLMAGEQSGRKHSDFDIALSTDYTEIFREVSKELGIYHGEKQNPNEFDVTVNGIVASVSEVLTKEQLSDLGLDKNTTDFVEENFFKVYNIDGIGQLKTYSLEAQRMMKEYAITTSREDGRGAFVPKDYGDLAKIIELCTDPNNKYGYDNNIYQEMRKMYGLHKSVIAFDSEEFEKFVRSGDHKNETRIATIGEQLLFKQIDKMRSANEKTEIESGLVKSADNHFGKLKEEKQQTLANLTHAYGTQPKTTFEQLMKEAAEKFREHGYTPEWEAKFRANLAKLPQTQTKDPNITTVPPIE